MQDLTKLFDLKTPIEGLYPVDRVDATQAAFHLLEEIRMQFGPVSIHHSGGSVDGSEPICLPVGELKLGDSDVPLGDLDGAPVYVDVKFLDAWQDRQLILDAVPGHGTGLGLDAGTGRRFLARSRQFTEQERAELDAVFP